MQISVAESRRGLQLLLASAFEIEMRQLGLTYRFYIPKWLLKQRHMSVDQD